MITATVRANGIHLAEQALPRAMRHHAKGASNLQISALRNHRQSVGGLTDTPKMVDTARECGGLCAPYYLAAEQAARRRLAMRAYCQGWRWARIARDWLLWVGAGFD